MHHKIQSLVVRSAPLGVGSTRLIRTTSVLDLRFAGAGLGSAAQGIQLERLGAHGR